MASIDSAASRPPASVISRVLFWTSVGFALAYCGVLIGAFSIQLFAHEFPCPLCMLQRYDMILAVIPHMWVISASLKGKLTKANFARCLGMPLLASVAGGIESIRQILPRIATKGDPGYGLAVLGLHLYTWTLIIFVCIIFYCSVALMLLSLGSPVARDT